MVRQDSDILIIGGGLVGLAVAATLKNSGLKITIVEAKADKPADPRAIALATTSKNMLAKLGVWDADLAAQAQPIHTIKVSQQGCFGKARLRAREHDLDALGYVVPATALQKALATAAAHPDCQILQPAEITELREVPSSFDGALSSRGSVSSSRGTAKQAFSCRTDLVLIADGVTSPWRKQLQLPTQQTIYDNVAIVANVTVDQDHQGVACERFTDDGLMAMLPLPERQFGLVWSVPKAKAHSLTAGSPDAFLHTLQQQFGSSLGRFTAVNDITSFPLAKITVAEPWLANMLLLGSSAHHLHPVAGQGFNLSLRDVACLAELLVAQHAKQQPLGEQALLQRFQVLREEDWGQVNLGTHQLVNLFSAQGLPVKCARTLGLAAVDRLLPLKQQLVSKASGFNGALPGLVSGLDLASAIEGAR